MLTPVYLEDVNAYDVIQVLKDKYEIFVNPCGGKLADKIIRVSHIGNTTIKDIDNLIEKMQPERFSDIATAIALYRPGPMEFIKDYANTKNKNFNFKFL